MNKKNLNQHLFIAKEAVLKAGSFLSKYKRENIKIFQNTGKDIKISADKEAEKIIIDILQNKTNISIFSEEQGLVGGSKKGNLRWVVDPLDGSLNFSRGIPCCCISIGLWDKEKPLLGVIYDFNRKELFTGISGIGAWLNKKKILVSETKSKSKAILMTGFPSKTDYSRQALENYLKQVQDFKKVRLLGSAALSLVYVACGRADAYFEKDIRVWDIAAGLAVLSGAGGKYILAKSNIENAFIVLGSNKYLNIKNI